MRALVLETPGPLAAGNPLELREVPDPAPGPGELLVRVAACAVCRTDLQLVEGDLAARRLPVIPGHQVVGRVEALGAGVDGWSVGRASRRGLARRDVRRLSGMPGGPREPLPAARFTGWDRDGGFAERMTVGADFALRLPDGFADLAAAPLLCGGVIGYRSLLVSGIRPGGRLGLYGFGASAHARDPGRPPLGLRGPRRDELRSGSVPGRWSSGRPPSGVRRPAARPARRGRHLRPGR